MNKPEISSNFTIDDIHKIREYHYEYTKNMTAEERAAFYKEGAEKVSKSIEARRTQKTAFINQ